MGSFLYTVGSITLASRYFSGSKLAGLQFRNDFGMLKSVRDVHQRVVFSETCLVKVITPVSRGYRPKKSPL